MDWRKIKTDLMLALSSHLLQKLVGYFVIVVLAHHLDKPQMGEFFFAAAMAYVFATMSEVGVNKHMVRRIAENNHTALEAYSEAISVRLPLLLASLLILNLIIALTKPHLFTIVLLTSIYVYAGDFYFTIGSLFVGLRRVGCRFVTQLIGQTLVVALILATVWMGGGLYEILIVYAAANVALVVSAMIIAAVVIGRTRLVRPIGAMKRVLPQALPFFVLTFLSLIVFKVDTLMIGYMRDADEVARYESSYKVFEISRFLVRPAATVFFPLCAATAAAQRWDQFGSMLGKLMLIAVGLGAAVMTAVLIAADWIVPFIYGDQYRDSVVILRVLYLTAPTLYLGFVAMFLANSLHLEFAAIRIMLMCLIFNVVLNAILIPAHGAVGAAWATVATETAAAIALVWLVAVNVRRKRVQQTDASPDSASSAASSPHDERIDHEPTI